MKKRYITAVCCLLAAVLTSLCASLQAQQQRLAEKLIDEGAALKKLEEFVKESNR